MPTTLKFQAYDHLISKRRFLEVGIRSLRVDFVARFSQFKDFSGSDVPSPLIRWHTFCIQRFSGESHMRFPRIMLVALWGLSFGCGRSGHSMDDSACSVDIIALRLAGPTARQCGSFING